MESSSKSDWQVEQILYSIQYSEGSNVVSLHWEFGGTEVALIIYADTEFEWGRRFPWAVGRQQEILDRMAQHVLLRAPDYKAEIEKRGDYVYLLIRGGDKRPDPQDEYDRARAKYIADGSLIVPDSDDADI